MSHIQHFTTRHLLLLRGERISPPARLLYTTRQGRFKALSCSNIRFVLVKFGFGFHHVLLCIVKSLNVYLRHTQCNFKQFSSSRVLSLRDVSMFGKRFQSRRLFERRFLYSTKKGEYKSMMSFFFLCSRLNRIKCAVKYGLNPPAAAVVQRMADSITIRDTIILHIYIRISIQ